MANETAGTAPVAAPTETGQILALQNVYLKDCSYESPNGPRLEATGIPR